MAEKGMFYFQTVVDILPSNSDIVGICLMNRCGIIQLQDLKIHIIFFNLVAMATICLCTQWLILIKIDDFLSHFIKFSQK